MWDPKFQPLAPGGDFTAHGVEIRNGVAWTKPDSDDAWLVDLVQDVRDAAQKMSNKNAHKQVLVRCEAALIQLAVRVGELSREKANAPTETHPVGHIIIP